MQSMTWPLGRLGSRFSLLFEPHRRRVMHGALGRFLDRPLDLAVGLVEPDGTERVLPFTRHGEPLYACEQFERINSITFRGYDEKIGLKFELNLHSPFYPQDERLCLAPVFYLELRVTWTRRIRWLWEGQSDLSSVKLFLRLNRPDTDIQVTDGRIDLAYDVPLEPRHERVDERESGRERSEGTAADRTARVRERIVSLNEGAEPCQDAHGGKGLTLDLPITPEGSGIKWRFIWAAHTPDPVMDVVRQPARFRYLRYWPTLEDLLAEAIQERDNHLAHSRRFEKLLEQAPLLASRRHLISQGFQSYLTNTFWMDVETDQPDQREWFSVWEGSCLYHSTVDVEYNAAMFYFACWPDLLARTIHQWVRFAKYHPESGGSIVNHDLGQGLSVRGSAYPHDMPVEENANFLLILQAYTHWTGDTQPLQGHGDFVRKISEYLIWTDRDDSGFPSHGTANTVDDGAPAIQFARKQTYLAIKRVMALHAAADLLSRIDDETNATRCRDTARQATPKIEQQAWLGDHFAVCVDPDTTGIVDVWTGKPLPMGEIEGGDDYSIYTTNGLLYPELIGRPSPFNVNRLRQDITSAVRETLTPYGCAHTSSDVQNVWISQNVWRDLVGRYIGAVVPPVDPRYWDLQVFSNIADQSFGFIDTYIGNELCFYPRGAVAFGHFLAGPRLRMDRLAEDGPRITIQPDRFRHSRWPLLALADWTAGRIPVCVVDYQGNVTIEGEIENVTVLPAAGEDRAE